MYERKFWLDTMLQIAKPVVLNLASGTLKQNMPVEAKAEREVRARFTHLEAMGRTLSGIAPWLENRGLSGEEEVLRQEWEKLVLTAIDKGTDPASPDVLNFKEGRQPLVDAAFFAFGLLRAPTRLIDGLDARVRQNVIDRLKETRRIKPGFNNWILFAAMVEALLHRMGEWYDPMRMDYALRIHEIWYLGDGVYSDGQEFCMDHYNSFVIHPMLSEICGVFCPLDSDWADFEPLVEKRGARYAVIQERSINPDGTFMAIGRSLAYRFGAFQHLAQMALKNKLPEELPPEQVRCALTALIKKIMEPADTFDENGWLTIGLYGRQPSIGEVYISTGSLYLCCAVFLPLGLPPSDRFWSGPAVDWSSKRIWSGQDIEADEALHMVKHQTVFDHDEFMGARKHPHG